MCSNMAYNLPRDELCHKIMLSLVVLALPFSLIIIIIIIIIIISASYFIVLSVRLPEEFCAFYFFLAGPTTLFIVQSTCEKRVNSVLPFKNYLAIMFSAISFQFSAK